MEITLSPADDLSRRALEALAVDVYLSEELTLDQVSQLLRLSRLESEDLLSEHQVPLARYDDAELDREAGLFAIAAQRASREPIP